MKHLTERYDEEQYKSSLLDFYFEGMRIGVLDIETTGLNPVVNKFILGGLLNCRERTLHQFFAENTSEEADALKAFAEELSKVDMVVTYNGRNFDMPFLERRLSLHLRDTDRTIGLPYNLDLYPVVRGYSPIKKFVPNLKQKTVENYMGLWQSREDEISGADSVELYNAYEKTCNPDLEKRILLHNSDDVKQLTRLLKVLTKCDLHKAMFHLGFPAGPLTTGRIHIEKDCLVVSGTQRTISADYIGFDFNDFPVETRFESRNDSFTMKFPVVRDSGLTVLDLDAIGLNRSDFSMYPSSSSGFLVIETVEGINYMEVNHFIKTFIHLLTPSLQVSDRHSMKP